MKFLSPLIAIICLLITACSDGPGNEGMASALQADTIYYGGDIITMAGASPEYVEALAVADGKILYAGNKQQALGYQGDNTALRDLTGKTLLPGFIDAHSHFMLTAVKLSTVNLDPPPAGTVTSITEMVDKLKTELLAKPRKKGEWLFSWGYDHAMLAEARHPTKHDLDQVSTEIPIAAYHFSAHMVVLNSVALELLGFDENSVAPEGGVIQRMPGSMEPNGIIEEQALLPVKKVMLDSAQGEVLIDLFDKTQQVYMSEGFTTITEMAGFPHTVRAMQAYAESGALKIDLMTAVLAVAQKASETAKQFSQDYSDHFRVGGGKVNLDGGTPGRTAYLREPYYTQNEGVDADYRGYSSIAKQEDVNTLVASFYQQKIPIFIHALGDAAIDQAIAAVDYAEKNYPREDIRTQLIHLQVFKPDQMKTLSNHDVTLSFQNGHNFFFADFHNEFTLGPERTNKLCPMNSAMESGFSVTMHHDSPVLPVSQLDLIWIAANRTSRSDKVYGEEERISVYQALQASTINAAYQFFEEDKKGSLVAGKLADFVVLDKNPLKVAVETVKDITVMETIKEGETVWKKL